METSMRVRRIVRLLTRVVSVLAGALFVLSAASASGAQQPASYQQGYEILRDAVYDQSMSIETVESLYHEAEARVKVSSLGKKERSYWRSLVEYMVGRAYHNENDKKSAARHYEAGLAYVRESLEQGEYSEGYRVMSEIISQMCLVKSVGFVLRNGRKVNEYAKKAIELDPRNGKAHIIIASSRIYPPAAFGGNREMGIERMQKALTMPDIEKDDLFNIYSGIGIAYSKLNKPQQGIMWLEKALRLYPGNEYVLEEVLRLR
jgi:tetratricopeptide (TPR) repeat protein